MNEIEGEGIGRCIIVLLGGRAGGHQAAVLNAVGISALSAQLTAEWPDRAFTLAIR